MAQFSVKTKQALLQAEQEKKMAGELRDYEDSIRTIANNLSFQSSALENIRTALRGAANQVGAQREGMSKMSTALSEIMENYNRTEQRIYNNAGGKGNLNIKQLADSIIDKFCGEEQYIQDFVRNLIESVQGSNQLEWIFNQIEDFERYIGKSIQSIAGNPGLLLVLPEFFKNSKVDYTGIIDKIKEGIADATDFEKKISKEGAYYDKKIKSDHGSLGVSALAYKAYAGVEGGLFKKDDDGNLVFNPNIAAKVGASFTALEVVGAYAIGNDYLGANVNGNITAGKINAEAEATANLMDDSGNFNPHAKLNASAEAILVDAKASAGVTVLGTKADVTGSVNVGVGAHAKVEIGDGKIACDIGASLGIGASVKFELDYSGTVKAVKSAAKSALKSIAQNTMSGLWK